MPRTAEERYHARWYGETAGHGYKRYPFIILLLDMDGVFNIINPASPDDRMDRLPIGEGRYHQIFPIPMTNVLLQTIAQDWRLRPIWNTCWYKRAWLWNERAGTARFPVAHEPARRHVDRWYPGVLPEGRYDWKLASALYYRKQYPTRRIVWLEDGFYPETERWAATDPLVTLVDTTKENVRDLLLADGDVKLAAETFISLFIWKPKEG